MKSKRVRLFIKPYCGWCDEAIEWLEQRGVAFETLDVISDARAFKEMIALSNQRKAPVIDVDGQILADFGAGELEAWWTEQGFAAD